ncbi:MAG: DUF4293 domain-containing protein [Cytophagaceae bacterium]
MIQRVQSILLFLSALLMLTFLFVPIWQGSNNPRAVEGKSFDGKATLDAFTLKVEGIEKTSSTSEASIEKTENRKAEETNMMYTAILAMASVLMSLYTIFQFKNRPLQIKLSMLNSLIIIGALGCVFLGVREGKSFLPSLQNDDFLIGFYLPVVALVSNVFAVRMIRKDEKLVKSADRFR